MRCGVHCISRMSAICLHFAALEVSQLEMSQTAITQSLCVDSLLVLPSLHDVAIVPTSGFQSSSHVGNFS